MSLDLTEEEIDRMCREENVILPEVEGDEDEFEIEPTD